MALPAATTVSSSTFATRKEVRVPKFTSSLRWEDGVNVDIVVVNKKFANVATSIEGSLPLPAKFSQLSAADTICSSLGSVQSARDSSDKSLVVGTVYLGEDDKLLGRPSSPSAAKSVPVDQCEKSESNPGFRRGFLGPITRAKSHARFVAKRGF